MARVGGGAKFLDQHLSLYPTEFKWIKGFRNRDPQNFNVKLEHFDNAAASANARGSAIALPELDLGELKIVQRAAYFYQCYFLCMRLRLPRLTKYVGSLTWPQSYKINFMLNSAEHENFPANKC